MLLEADEAIRPLAVYLHFEDIAKSSEQFAKVVFCDVIRQIPDVDLH